MGRYNPKDEANWDNDPGEEKVTDKQYYRHLAQSNFDPELIQDEKSKAKYLKFLKTYKPD